MDFCHRGHINILKEMRARAGDGLVIVVLHDDAAVYRIKGKIPVQDIQRRIRNLQITGLVDEILVTQLTDPADQFMYIRETYEDADLWFLRGDDNPNPPGRWYLDYWRITQEYIPYTDGISSTEISEMMRG